MLYVPGRFFFFTNGCIVNSERIYRSVIMNRWSQRDRVWINFRGDSRCKELSGDRDLNLGSVQWYGAAESGSKLTLTLDSRSQLTPSDPPGM